MRIVQLLSQRLLAAVVLLLGVLLLAGIFTDLSSLVDQVTATYGGLPTLVQGAIRVLGGLLLAGVGLLGLMPALKSRSDRSRRISFAGAHGDVFIQLDSVENTITRVIGKMPEVNRISVQVVPSDEGRKVLIMADVILNNLSNIGAREAANRVSNQIMYAATHILGVDEVTGINLRVRRIAVDLKALKATPAALATGAVAAPAQTIEGVEEAERAMREQIDQALREEGVHVPAPETGVEAERETAQDQEESEAVEVEPEPVTDEVPQLSEEPDVTQDDVHPSVPPAYRSTMSSIGEAASALELEEAKSSDASHSETPGYGLIEDVSERPLEVDEAAAPEPEDAHDEDASRETHHDADLDERK